ncbi:hypothetical protein WDU94_007903 [Cyamophila willieti]
MNEILVRKVNTVNIYEQIQQQIEKYTSAVKQNIEPLNKTYVLKLVKKLMKCREVSFEDFADVLKNLQINLNINNNNEFLIKHGNKFSDQDETIMKQTYNNMYARYHAKLSNAKVFNNCLGCDTSENKDAVQSLVETQTLVEDPLESFESFKAVLNSHEVDFDGKSDTLDKIELEITSINEIEKVDEILKNVTEDGMDIEISGNIIDDPNVTIPLNELETELRKDILAQDLDSFMNVRL